MRISNIPEFLQFEQITTQLSRIEGDGEAVMAHITLSNLTCSVLEDVQCRLEQVICSVAQKVNGLMHSVMEQVVKKMLLHFILYLVHA